MLIEMNVEANTAGPWCFATIEIDSKGEPINEVIQNVLLEKMKTVQHDSICLLSLPFSHRFESSYGI